MCLSPTGQQCVAKLTELQQVTSAAGSKWLTELTPGRRTREIAGKTCSLKQLNRLALQQAIVILK